MKMIFILTGILFFIFLLTGQMYFYKHKNRFIREKSVTITVFSMIIYCLLCLYFVFTASIYVKPVYLLCAFSPFLTGYYASYEKLKFYTFLQLMTVAFSVILTVRIL